jgi:protein-L-isoaspartate(D-aspartate) O-methyltransferase
MIKARSRQKLVEEIEKHIRLDENVKNAFLTIDREAFVPTEFQHLAYKLDALPLVASQWISSPLTVAKMTQYLDISNIDSVLEIGCGSGYQAAILSQLARRVFTIERIDELLKLAKMKFKAQELDNIFARFDDGQRGWKEYAPYDRILFSATAKKIPNHIFDQLKEGGILIAPIEKSSTEHIITKFHKNNGEITEIQLDKVRFVPILDGTQK